MSPSHELVTYFNDLIDLFDNLIQVSYNLNLMAYYLFSQFTPLFIIKKNKY